MIDGTSALQLESYAHHNPHRTPITQWTLDQHFEIIQALLTYGCKYLKGREEYTLLKEIVVSQTDTPVTEVLNFGNGVDTKNPVNSTVEGSGVISPLCNASMLNDTTPKVYSKPFLAPLDILKA